MGKTATNLSLILGLITIAFAGYYMYTQRDATVLSFDANEQTMEDMLNNTQVFIQRRQTLDTIKLNLQFFEDERLLSLRSFSAPITERPIGRPDPFADTRVSNTGGI